MPRKKLSPTFLLQTVFCGGVWCKNVTYCLYVTSDVLLRLLISVQARDEHHHHHLLKRDTAITGKGWDGALLRRERLSVSQREKVCYYTWGHCHCLSLPGTKTDPALLFPLLTPASVEWIQEMFCISSETQVSVSLCDVHKYTNSIRYQWPQRHKLQASSLKEQSIHSK